MPFTKPPLAYAGHLIGPFPVNWDDANVGTTGVPLWTPNAGDHILDMRIEIVNAFTGSGGFTKAYPKLLTASDTIVDFSTPSMLGFAAADVGVDIYLPAAAGTIDGLSLGALASFLQFDASTLTGLPTRMKSSTPINLVLTPDMGALTAGKVNVWALVATS